MPYKVLEDSNKLDENLLAVSHLSPDPMPSSFHLSVTMAALGLSDWQSGGYSVREG